MNAREERGLVIAATQRLTQKGKVWLVPSQTGNGRKYTVCPDPENPFCSCPDHEETGFKCKHIYAVEFAVGREHGTDGTIVETKTLTFTEKSSYKKTNWPVYNLAQLEEKRRFLALLHDLCRNLEDPPHTGSGRKRTAMADVAFTAVYKVYSQLSTRRFGTDLDGAFESGYLTRKLTALMAWSFLENPKLTPVLMELIRVSSLPLKVVETEFAVDSSGFSTSRFSRWFDHKYGVVRQKADWVKVHIACGVKTHIVTAVEILDKDAADSPQFKPLIDKTAQNFTIDEVSADKAYLSVENIEAVFAKGGTPYIAFKENSTGSAGGLFEKMFHFYSMNKAEYMASYHKRSNVESVMSMIKAKFRDNVRSKIDVAMKNEVLCKILAHNICCLIMSQCDLGIEPIFWGDGEKAATVQEERPEEVIEAATIIPVAVPEPMVVKTLAAPLTSRFLACAGA